MNRRGFLGSILAAAAAPAIVRADSLMRVIPRDVLIYRRPIPFGVDIDFTSADLAMRLDAFSRAFIQPVMASLALHVENEVLLSVRNERHRLAA